MWYRIIVWLIIGIVTKVAVGKFIVQRFIAIPMPLIILFAVLFSIGIAYFEYKRTMQHSKQN